MRSVALASALFLGAQALHVPPAGPEPLTLAKKATDADTTHHRRLIEELAFDVADLEDGPKGTSCGKPINPTNDFGRGLSLICKSKKTKIQVWKRGANERILSTGGRTTAGKVFCKEECKSCKVTSSDLQKCEQCPCTILDPTANMYSYIGDMVKMVHEQCKGNPFFNVLHIGLGAGGLVHAVNKVCRTKVVRIVEYQEDVILLNTGFLGLNAKQVAPKMLTSNAGMEVTQSDGEAAAMIMADKMPGTFDMILVDCMNNGYIPDGCRSSKLYTSFRKLLKPGGGLGQWTWDRQIDEVAASVKEVFGNSAEESGWVTSRA